ncbi:GNAT family N-acetyltransferase [Mycolicibacterium sp. 120266]|uniref:GNAT family N-acetyltransferase n=1 Tax=Mycolicibacterium sp. 120266 TaxID=3090601 RepID=UPI00299F2418|nr:GNAT family N-acetyltransferase [Mycolicibacterium sp. 120266]MDX1871607.1 GNAT family N-acetyltransferase [Mycolicibacterium sp. 120266]
MSVVNIFPGTELAARIEAAETALISAGATDVRPLAGGAACFAGPDSPLTKVVGLGFGGVPADADLDEIEREYARRGAAVQVELSNLADPQIGAMLTGRGYRLVSFENVLGTRPVAEPGVPGVRVDKARADELRAWVDVVVDGFAHPDAEGVPSHEEFPRDVLAAAVRDMVAAGAVTYLARCSASEATGDEHGVSAIAGGASMRITDGVAQLTGAATAPAFRRRGVQSALLSARLSDADAAGADIAVVTTSPGSRSQQNVQRKGFQLLYTRAILVR